MSGAKLWVWDKDNSTWVELQSGPDGKLRIASIDDAEISQATPEDLKHVPHGYYAAGAVYKPYAVSVDGKLLLQTAALDHLDDIGDVNVPAPTNKYLLYWDTAAGKWQCQALSGYNLADLGTKILNDLDDVNIPSPSNLRLIRYDDATGKWVELACLTASDAGAITSLVSYLSFYTKAVWNDEIRIYSYDGSSYVCVVHAIGGVWKIIVAQLEGNLNAATYKIVNLADPVAAQDADTKAARDAAIAAKVYTKIADADGDTKVDVEEGADDDAPKIYAAGAKVAEWSNLGILTLAKQSGAAGYQTVDQTITTGTDTVIDFNTLDLNPQNEFNLTNDRYTATEPGVYFAFLAVMIQNIADTNYVKAAFFINGAERQSRNARSTAAGQNVSSIIGGFLNLAASDYVEFMCKHAEGADRDTKSGQNKTYFGIFKVA